MRDFALKLNELLILVDEYCRENDLYREDIWIGGKHFELCISLHHNDGLKLHTVLSLPTDTATTVQEAWQLKSVYPQ